MLYRIKEPAEFVSIYGESMVLSPTHKYVDSIIYDHENQKAHVYTVDGEKTVIEGIKKVEKKTVKSTIKKDAFGYIVATAVTVSALLPLSFFLLFNV